MDDDLTKKAFRHKRTKKRVIVTLMLADRPAVVIEYESGRQKEILISQLHRDFWPCTY